MIPTSELAALVGVSPRRLWQIAKARDIQPAMRLRGAALWSERDAKRLKPGKPGRPTR